jgi:nucleotide-binding universal stress UspA family protein
MSIYQRILVPIDGSDTARLGLAEAIRLAKLSGGRLRVFHVIDDLSFALAMDAYAGHPGDWLHALREEGTRLLEDAERAAAAAGVKVDAVLHESFNGKVADVIAAEACKWPADLIVVGTHGRRGIGRLVLGSGAESILRSAPVPVLLVRAPESAQRLDEAPETAGRVSVVTGALAIE